MGAADGPTLVFTQLTNHDASAVGGVVMTGAARRFDALRPR